jgi:hypothetical protein
MARNYVAFARTHKWLYSVMMEHAQLDWSAMSPEELELMLRPLRCCIAWLREGAGEALLASGPQHRRGGFRLWLSMHGLCSMLNSGRIDEKHPVFPFADQDTFVEHFIADTRAGAVRRVGRLTGVSAAAGRRARAATRPPRCGPRPGDPRGGAAGPARSQPSSVEQRVEAAGVGVVGEAHAPVWPGGEDDAAALAVEHRLEAGGVAGEQEIELGVGPARAGLDDDAGAGEPRLGSDMALGTGR